MINDSTIVAIIPARGGSKGIPRKNLCLINGKSLLEMAIETSKASRYIDRVIVSSEDEETIRVAKNAGADVPFVRPAELARDETPGIDPVLHALEEVGHYDFTMLLQVTSPLRCTDDIDRCIEHFYHQNSPACVSVVEPDKHPNWMFSLNSDQTLTPLISDKTYQRRQDLPLVYVLNGAIYIAKTNWLRQTKTFITNQTTAFVMPKERSLDIDTAFDFTVLEACLNRNNDKYAG